MKWAIVAGGSKGLGLSIAKALAGRKFNILLIARNQHDLLMSKEELQSHYGIQVDIFVCDLSSPESAAAIRNYCTGNQLELKILCNAAGLGGAKDFHNLPLADLRAMVRTNLESAVALSFELIPLLKNQAPSYILNIGSMAGFAPLPAKSVYSATKSALLSFSYSLKTLLREKGISVTCACPGPLFTKPSIEEETIRQLGWFGKQMAVNPDDAGEAIVRSMMQGKMVVVPGRLAKGVSFLLRITPAGLMAQFLHSNKRNTK